MCWPFPWATIALPHNLHRCPPDQSLQERPCGGAFAQKRNGSRNSLYVIGLILCRLLCKWGYTDANPTLALSEPHDNMTSEAWFKDSDTKAPSMFGYRNILQAPKDLRGFGSFWVGVLIRMTRIFGKVRPLFRCKAPRVR